MGVRRQRKAKDYRGKLRKEGDSDVPYFKTDLRRRARGSRPLRIESTEAPGINR